MKILYITDYIPYPLIAGDRIRVYNLIRRIAKHHDVSLVGFIKTPEEIAGVLHMKEFCQTVEAVNLPQRPKLTRLPRLLRYALAGKPFDLEFLYSDDFRNKVRSLASSANYDIIQIEHSRMALYEEALPQETVSKQVLVFHNIAAGQYSRIAQIALTPARRIRALLYSLMLHRWEPRYAERFDRCITVSEVDRCTLISANPRLQVQVVPNGVDTQIYQPLKLEGAKPALLLVGNMSYPPCSDGALWFCNEILPQIRRLADDLQVWIVGQNPPPEVCKLNGGCVHVTGRVDDVLPYYKRTTISIVPLRAGGGTRLKILEAMALGRPIVSTTLGCEGLDVIDGEHLMIADDPEQFAVKTVRLLENKALYTAIVAKARGLVVTKYDWEAITEQLVGIYSELKSYHHDKRQVLHRINDQTMHPSS